MKLEDFMTMKNGDYHEQQIAYNMTATLAELKKQYPDITPQGMQAHAAEINKSVYAPKFHGELPESLGIKDKVLTLDMWRDLSAGYCPATWLEKDSLLRKHTIETPRGLMVRLNRNALKINADGSFAPPADTDKGHTIGTEMMFSTGGNLSKTLVKMFVEDPTAEERFKAIVDKALDCCMKGMLEDAYIRLGKDGTELQYAKEIMAVSFLHIENRGVTESGSSCPFIHVHFDLMNVARGENDSLGSLFSGYIAKNKAKFSAEYMSIMKGELEKEFGFVFEEVLLKEDAQNKYLKPEERNITSYDLPDSAVPENVRKLFNKREEEIEAQMKADGKSGPIAKEIARVKSRDSKAELSPSEMKTMWKKDFDDLGWTMADIEKHLDFNQRRPNYTTITDETLASNFSRKVQSQEMARSSKKSKPDAEDFIDRITGTIRTQKEQQDHDDELVRGFLRKTKELVFTEDQFKSHITIQLLKSHDKDHAEREAARIFESQCLAMIQKEQIPYYKEFLLDEIEDPVDYRQKQIRYARDMVFTTKGVVEKEHYITDTTRARSHETAYVFTEQEAILERLKFEEKMSEELKTNVQFSKGQLGAFHETLTQPGSMSLIKGMAGTGKTFAMRAMKEAYEGKGYNVWGMAPSSTAAEGLGKDAQIKKGQCGNISEMLLMLDERKIQWDSKSVVILDEAAMVGLDSWHRIVKHANQAGAKIVACGDFLQLNAVEHGATFRVLTEQFVAQEITEINRQKSSVHRDMVMDFAAGNAHKALRTLYDEGRVIIYDTEKQRMQGVAQSYLKNPEPFEKKIIIGTSNDEVEAINNAVRDQLKAQGKLQGKEAEVTCEDGTVRNFAVGDRAIFVRNNKSSDMQTQKLKNSDIGTIISLRTNKLTGGVSAIQLKMDNGNTVWKNTRDDDLPIRHGYCSTVHKSQGQTRNDSDWAPSATVNSLHLSYVAASRHRNNITIHLSKEMADKLATKMDLEDKPPTPQMLKVAEWVSKKENVVMEPGTLDSFLQTRSFLDKHYYKIADGGEFAPHPTDDFSSLMSAMSASAMKKSTFDYQLIDGTRELDIYRNVRQDRKNEVEQKPEVAMQGEKVKLDVGYQEPLRTAAQEKLHREVMTTLAELERRKEIAEQQNILKHS